MENKGDECFKWCVVRAINPVERASKRITTTLRIQAKKFIWDEIEQPAGFPDIDQFERPNASIGVNVFGYEKEKFYPLRISALNELAPKIIDFLLISHEITRHYC